MYQPTFCYFSLRTRWELLACAAISTDFDNTNKTMDLISQQVQGRTLALKLFILL